MEELRKELCDMRTKAKKISYCSSDLLTACMNVARTAIYENKYSYALDILKQAVVHCGEVVKADELEQMLNMLIDLHDKIRYSQIH